MWSPNYLREFNHRLHLKNLLKNDERLQDCYHVYYKYHLVDWINDWAITFDPRVPGALRLMPFKLFPRQEDFCNFVLGCFTDKEAGLVEKSRDMGATWLCVAISVWLWLYHPGTVIGWGSMKEDAVDKKGDPKAIFPKIRQLIQHLPSFMRPHGFKMSVHAPYMRIINPANSASIIGEAGDNMGRGGRTSIYFKDESAHYERPELIEAALGDNTDVQIDMSSVNGTANVFYRRRMSGEEWFPDKVMPPHKTRVFIFDWRDHPNKSEDWHEERRKKAEAEGLLHIFAQEVDRDYYGSVDRIIIRAEWARAAIDAHIKLKFTDDGEKIAAQDVADGGGDKNALAIRHGVVLKFCDNWGGEAGEAAKRAVPSCIEYGVTDLNYDSIGVGAGFKTELNTMKSTGALPANMRIVPWNAGANPLDPEKHIIPTDKQSPTNEDQYLNIKAQAWFRLRARFYKTFRAVTHGDKYDPAELISLDSSIPLIHQLILELAQATYDSNGKGKTIIEKKPNNTMSPNLADAVVMCYCPIKQPIGFFDASWKL